MTDEQVAWARQFYGNIGLREYRRLTWAVLRAIFWGFFLTAMSGLHLFLYIAFLAAMGLPLLAQRWPPAYRLFRAILGNNLLPQHPMPRR